MRPILRPGCDPALEDILLRVVQRMFHLGRRHEIVLVGGEDAGDEFAFPGLTRHDDGFA
jgi:hypothetical protein